MTFHQKYIGKIIVVILLLLSLTLAIWVLLYPESYFLRSWIGCKSRPYSEIGRDNTGNWCQNSSGSIKIYQPQNTTAESIEPLKFINISQDQKISSPLTIKGQAPGNWFFEGSFPIKITDSTGNTLGSGTAKSIGDWMTSSLVDFTAIITFEETHDTQGFIIFSKDNPSGLPENDQSIKLPIKFETNKR